MDGAYAKVLEHGLLSRAVALDKGDAQDSTTLSVLVRTSSFRGGVAPPPKPAAPAPAAVGSRSSISAAGGPALGRSQRASRPPFGRTCRTTRRWCRSPSGCWPGTRCSSGLGHFCCCTPTARWANWWTPCSMLTRISRSAAGCRIMLAYTSSQRAVDGLMPALEDSRFEIRFNTSRALDFLHRMSDGLHFDGAALMQAVERELSISRSVREGRRLLGPPRSERQPVLVSGRSAARPRRQIPGTRLQPAGGAVAHRALEGGLSRAAQ